MGVLVNYEGITVEKDTKLRKQLREAGCEYKVVKNTLLSLAFQEAGIEGLEEHLHGATAIAYSCLLYTSCRPAGPPARGQRGRGRGRRG